ncbi:MAG: glycosyltransferase family 4 protein [Parvibaculales bacterium]
MTKILIVSDAWAPQVNGVVTTLQTVIGHLREAGHEVKIISPDMFNTVPLPVYPEIKLAVLPKRKMARLIDMFAPERVHIATEGPLGWAARAICLKRGWRFSTSYHTKFPEYAYESARIPLKLGYNIVKRFHGKSAAMMVATQSLEDDLKARGFSNAVTWTRGVDTNLYKRQGCPALELDKPVMVYVGRVSVEKNIEAFLDLDLPGSKLVVGGGPQLEKLKSKYTDVTFTGPKFGEELAAHYRSGDVFVFPSKTDTFGLVMLEAMACGLPVAAYPVTGPLDVLADCTAGKMNEDLAKAIKQALTADPQAARDHALKFSWEACAKIFLSNLTPL